MGFSTNDCIPQNHIMNHLKKIFVYTIKHIPKNPIFADFYTK